MGRMKELATEIEEKEFVIKKGVGGKHYAVFINVYWRMIFTQMNPELFSMCRVTGFAALDNAYELPDWWVEKHKDIFEKHKA